MAIDTPARIAVLGAGPIGLEAALYARYLGYDVDVYERSQVAEHVEQWGHVQMFTPFGQNRSPLGMAALKAQDPNWQPPDDDALLTGRDYRRRYLLPLAQSDLLIDSLHPGTEVLAVGREGWLKGEGADSEERADSDFRLLLRTTDPSGHAHERFATAQAVLDTTGTYGRHHWLGPDGLPAAGELVAATHVEYGLPDVLGADRERYAGRNILLVGDGDSAVTTLVALADLASQAPDTWITWATRSSISDSNGRSSDDVQATRRRIHEQARRLASDDANHVTHLSDTTVESLTWHPDLGRFAVRLGGAQTNEPSESEFDRVIANVGYRVDARLYEELQLGCCPRTGAVETMEPGDVVCREVDFYVLGAKSGGRNGRFVIADGLRQIQRVFAIIGDRADLDLYATMAKLA